MKRLCQISCNVCSSDFLQTLDNHPSLIFPLGESSGPSASHVRRLIHDYQLQEAETGGESGTAALDHAILSQAPRVRTKYVMARTEDGDGSDLEEGDDGEQPGSEEAMDSESSAAAWGNEEYEEESVKGLQTSYLKFASRLRRQPLQCVRWEVAHLDPKSWLYSCRCLLNILDSVSPWLIYSKSQPSIFCMPFVSAWLLMYLAWKCFVF